ncbi:MAG: GntR family transcriptional regulator [Asticcacaulis sp.]
MLRHGQGVSLTYNLLETLGQAIVIGNYEKAGFPTEAELCIRHGASRTVAREAVKMLTAKGLLSSRPRQGTRVEDVANWNLARPGRPALDDRAALFQQDLPRPDRGPPGHRGRPPPPLAARRATKADIRAIRHRIERHARRSRSPRPRLAKPTSSSTSPS